MNDVFKAVVIAPKGLLCSEHEAIYSAIKLLMRLLQSMKNRSRKDETSMVVLILAKNQYGMTLRVERILSVLVNRLVTLNLFQGLYSMKDAEINSAGRLFM